MSAHTPGPWIVVTELRQQDEIVADMVNQMWVVPARGQALGCNRADAKLIAAAPDLLQVVQTLIVTLERGEHCPTDEWNAALDLANAAVNKAGGQS